MFRHRVPQEFYDLEKDPSSLNNLIHDPKYQDLVKKFQGILRQWMVDTHDFCLPSFDVRDDPAKLATAVANYPKLIGPPVSENEGDVDPSSAVDKNAKRKAKRAEQTSN